MVEIVGLSVSKVCGGSAFLMSYTGAEKGGGSGVGGVGVRLNKLLYGEVG